MGGLFDWKQSDVNRLSAHRGATNFAPENTLEAFREAINHNYRSVELDPRMTSDGVLYLMHDSTVDRTTDGTGVFESLTSAQIDTLKIDTSAYPSYSNKTLKVPTFDEAVQVISNSDLILNVDGSKGDWSNKTFTDKIMNVIHKYNMFDRTFFVISNKTHRAAFNKNYPDAILSWLYESSTGISNEIQTVKSYKRAIVSISAGNATQAAFDELKKSSIYFQVYGVNDQATYNTMLSRKAPMIETDKLVP
ncbi:glycerophosphodiester phosphodiesterase family protein [Enterococcus dongliensis]|uniref:glycerophosphodiester phosphodiesterase family protein n=1 Tax=Enterococcus dongliensis TaxID=2559925 RepID=UPI0028910EE5|nr:glycerophosphodiester phosphodiesterase family protein [Enterococcus dongliensis]MDT2677328.1 glycerophosphodiester phosphodiesterase family protein [Enterococcus dongliensis]